MKEIQKQWLEVETLLGLVYVLLYTLTIFEDVLMVPDQFDRF